MRPRIIPALGWIIAGLAMMTALAGITSSPSGAQQQFEPILRIEHTALNVADATETVNWLVKNLDMNVARRIGDPTDTHFVVDSAGKSMLEIYHDPAVQVPEYGKMDPLVLHIAFSVNDVATARERLMKAGATPIGEIKRNDAGDLLAMLRGPGGLAVQLVRRAKPMN